MDSKKFAITWKRYAVGTGAAAFLFTIFGSVLDHNPIRTLMVAALGFFLANLIFVIMSFLVDGTKR